MDRVFSLYFKVFWVFLIFPIFSKFSIFFVKFSFFLLVLKFSSISNKIPARFKTYSEPPKNSCQKYANYQKKLTVRKLPLQTIVLFLKKKRKFIQFHHKLYGKKDQKIATICKKDDSKYFFIICFCCRKPHQRKKYIKIENVYFFHYLLALLPVIKSFIGFKSSSFFGIFLLLLDWNRVARYWTFCIPHNLIIWL